MKDNGSSTPITFLCGAMEAVSFSWQWARDGHVLGALFIFLHLWLSKSDFQLCAAELSQMWSQPSGLMTRRKADTHFRFENELLKVRTKCIQLFRCLDFQLCLPLLAFSVHELMADPLQVLPAVPPFLQYFTHLLHKAGILKINLQICKAAGYMSYVAYLISIANLTDLEQFHCSEQVMAIGLIIVSVLFIDLKLALPTYSSGAAVLIYKHWSLNGGKFDRMLLLILMSHVLGAGASTFIVYCLHSLVAAKVESDSMDSVLRAFRKVLRGVCDGELVLDLGSYQILDDASSLERLLHAEKKLTDSNFLDLFLDTESQNTFTRFLQSESIQKDTTVGATAIPPSLRIFLQGAQGPVSMDVFATRFGAEGHDYVLLALKADPDQVLVPPDAEETVTLNWPKSSEAEINERFVSSSQASLEVTDAFKQLVQISMMVSNDTPSFDIEEITLSFFRSAGEHSGMPTLRNVIRLNDWQRLEAVFQGAQETQIPHRLADPLLIRIPGSKPRSYLCAKEVQVSTAEDEPLGTFSINLTGFKLKQTRPKDPELESISEVSSFS